MDRFPAAGELTPTVELTAELTAVKAVWTGINVGIDVHLVDADFLMSPGITVADLHEAGYPGYGAQAATVASLGHQQPEPDGSIRQESTTLLVFPEPSSGPPVTIYGYYLTESGAATALYRVFHLDAPVTLQVGSGPLNIILVVTQRGGTS